MASTAARNRCNVRWIALLATERRTSIALFFAKAQQLAHPLQLGGMRVPDHGRDKRALLGEVFAHRDLFSSVFLVIHLRKQSTLAFYFRLNPRTSIFLARTS